MWLRRKVLYGLSGWCCIFVIYLVVILPSSDNGDLIDELSINNISSQHDVTTQDINRVYRYYDTHTEEILDGFNKPFYNNSSWVDDWVKMDTDVYAYSAYLDSRVLNGSLDPVVRIFGWSTKRGKELNNMKCVIYTEYKHRRYLRSAVKVKMIGQTPKIFICSVSAKVSKYVRSAALETSDVEKLRWIRVHHLPLARNSDARGKIAACVAPFYHYMNNTYLVAQFLAFYRVVGIDHFTFYNFETGPRLRKMVENLSKRGLPIDFLPWSSRHWNLPNNLKKFREGGYAHITQIQDCLYRNMYRYEYVIKLDVDEFLVPYNKISLQQLMEELTNESCCDNYRFRQSIFCLKFPSLKKIRKDLYPFVTFHKVLGKPLHTRNWPDFLKYIVRPEKVIYGGIHNVREMTPGATSVKIEGSALIHHYRNIRVCNYHKEKKTAIMSFEIPQYYGKKMLEQIKEWKHLL
ncbi:beta-1,4-galactosyltransferase galt-1-like [Tachypleus tridentatus]|uniref:beta-1,4-galactosyltransferase galt-1-like n=1 Tax=Tachypleus tridentatus TaxID=6853 RepID=UPI003FD485A6